MKIFEKFRLFKIIKNYKDSIWSKEEDEILMKILTNNKRNKWIILLKALNDRSYKECFSRFKFLN